jgi:hypothetical protein
LQQELSARKQRGAMRTVVPSNASAQQSISKDDKIDSTSS